jgi:hypothetical protein
VELPEGNLFGVPAQTATFTVHAGGAVIRRLRPGQLTVTIEVAPDLGGACTFRVFVNVVRGGHHSDDEDLGEHDEDGHDHD